MNNLASEFEETQTAHSVHRMINSMASDFDLFKFLAGEKARHTRFENFIHLYHKNDANLARVLADFLRQNYNSSWTLIVDAARKLRDSQAPLAKRDLSSDIIEFVHGDKQIFDLCDQNYHFSKKQILANPGRHSANAYLIAFPQSKLFIKPTETLEKALHESKAYELSKELGLQEYLLPSCVIKIKKSKKTEQFAVVTKILPFDCVSLDRLDEIKPGANDGFVKSLLKNGLSHKLALFDYLLINGDRHKNNIFLNGNKFYLIDHTEAFEKKEKGFIPGYLRLMSYKINKTLPVSEDDVNIRNWLQKLSLEDENSNKVVKKLMESKSPSAAINDLWKKYYVE